MNERNDKPAENRLLGVAQRHWLIALCAVAVVATLVALGITALLVNIFEKKQEARNPFFRVIELTDDTIDPTIWGMDFPQQFDGYKRTVDMARTLYGGSEAEPRTPSEADPRSIIARSRLEQDPRLKIMWEGYAFAKDYREKRGHAYMLEDQTYTERQRVAQQPGTCIHCHASAYLAYKRLGGGDIFRGFDALDRMKYQDARKEVSFPVACIDCHNPQTMQLRITRPAFIEGIRAAKAAQGVENYDVNTMATRQEMRAYVCAQCHVEYYFKGPEKLLVYPWSKGLKADQILAYYDETGFKDWTHAATGAACLKAQHPEFETWSQGIHSRAGVACADCHMPYKRVGALKVSDHHVRSPVLNIANACQTCHRVPEDELKMRVETIQTRNFEMRNLTLDALVELIADIKKAKQAGATDERLAAPRDYQRKAQFLLDYVMAENSMGFHASQESARILNLSLDLVRRGQLAVRDQVAQAR